MAYRPGDPRATRAYRRARLYVLHRDQHVCYLCGRPGADSVDHAEPVSKGGHPFDLDNMKAAHLKCNDSKGTRIKVPVVTTIQW